MKTLESHRGLVAPLDRANVDTDAMIPKQFLKSIHRSGFGQFLFDEWRYLDRGEIGMDCGTRPLNPDFVLNRPRYAGATILLGRENFGCGSSREHAPWALVEYGFRVLVAPSFADIFEDNCLRNGLLPVTLPASVVDAMFTAAEATPGWSLEVDLRAQVVRVPEGAEHAFRIDPFHKQRLLEGLDDIGLTLKHADAIRAYELARRARRPWLVRGMSGPARG